VLRQSGRRHLERPVFLGLGLAVVASVAAAVALRLLPINGEAYEGALYWVSAVFVGTMMWWVHRNAKKLRTQIEQRVRQAVDAAPERSAREAWGLGAFAFLMIFREGAETVMLLSAVNLTTQAMLSFIGTLLGLAGAVVFGVMFVRGSLQVNLRRFFAVTEWVLAIFVVQLLINGYHEFSEAGVVPATQRSMALVGPIVRHNSLFILAIVAIPLLVWISGLKKSALVTAGLAEAERRLVLARAARERFYGYGAILSALVVLALVTVVYAREVKPKKLPPPEPVHAENGVVNIPLSALEDGNLHRYGFASTNRTVRFLVLKTTDGKIHTALDACEICGAFGYLQEGPNLICLNCVAEINPLTVGQPGGCNPVPLEAQMSTTELRVPVATLEKEAHRFPAMEQTGLTAIDPICGMMVNMNEAAAFMTVNGKTYYFCREKCRDLFQQKLKEAGH
jgi:FTR1 family protein